jgi:hypothetical protein
MVPKLPLMNVMSELMMEEPAKKEFKNDKE